MKQLTCEMCGSTELIKQEGFFVCQLCGTKYSVEEAKKMMIEGTVDVQGTVKVDNSALIEKSILNARRAKDKEDWEETEKYYNLVEQNDPTNIEAIFYSSYGKAMLSLSDNDNFKRKQKFNVFEKSISTIDENYDVSKSAELENIIIKMSSDLIKMSNSSFSFNTSQNKYGWISDDRSYTLALFANVEMKFIESIQNITKVDEKTSYYKILLTHYSRCITNKQVLQKPSERYQQLMMAVINRVKKLEPSFIAPEIPAIKRAGCYVATCVYGSYDCPQVWTLRRYRDNTLAATWYGRLFIRTYYAISPTLVKWFGKTKWFKKLWKRKLDRMVAKLQSNGVDDTPYEDKKW